jgi:hypothetical protein
LEIHGPQFRNIQVHSNSIKIGHLYYKGHFGSERKLYKVSWKIAQSDEQCERIKYILTQLLKDNVLDSTIYLDKDKELLKLIISQLTD